MSAREKWLPEHHALSPRPWLIAASAAFTFADALAPEPAYRSHLMVVPSEAWSDEQVPMAEYVAHAGPEPPHSVPFIEVATGDDEPARAVSALRRVVGRYPEHAPARALLGSALRGQGDLSGSRREAEAAIRLNPFDPRPHCDLAEAAEQEATREAEAAVCRRLGGRR